MKYKTSLLIIRVILMTAFIFQSINYYGENNRVFMLYLILSIVSFIMNIVSIMMIINDIKRSRSKA